MKRFWFLIPLAAFLALAVVLAVGLKLDPREVPSPLIDKPAPKFALARLDDATKTVRLDDLRGKAFILNVWASWCVACREEHPLLLEFARKRMVPIYGLNYKDTRPEAAIDVGFTRDLYVSLGEPIASSPAWIVRIYVKPFVDWIWGGCLVMALGGLLAATDRRYRARVRERAPAYATATA